VFKEHCTPAVLVMEWVDVIRLTDRKKLEELGVDTQWLLECGVKISLVQLLQHGFMHADPHPGNLLVSQNGTRSTRSA
ncbi:hypothetical protein CYMTET_14378, partial [Cymbomonas tetramitiformis]